MTQQSCGAAGQDQKDRNSNTEMSANPMLHMEEELLH